MKRLLISGIQFYRNYISPMTPPTCRFQPTCSQYGIEAIETHGALKGSLMTAVRISKCHPFHAGGFDPVPPKKDE